MESKKFNYLYFDMYSKRASFFYNNQERIVSNFGFILTLIYIIVSLIIFFYNINITIKRKDIKVYDSSMYAQEIPSIKLNSNNLYFAFGLEDPITNNRFIDESIYYPQILFIDRIKINGEFKTIFKKDLEYEVCNEENFGENYQHFFEKGQLNNSYCLKEFHDNLTLVGGFKYNQMTYIRIKIFPCVNTTENNYHCKSQEEIDYYLTNGYFSILVKDFGLNPSNYTYPILPTIQDLYTTIDKRLYRNFIINFGMTEVYTDKGFLFSKLEKKDYLQFRDTFQTFSFLEENEYLSGKEICIVQLRLIDNIYIQKRTYSKIPEIFSEVGGYMQLLYTIFSLISFFINKFNVELKIINSIFNFDIEKKKMTLKYQSLKDFDSKKVLSRKKNLIFSRVSVFKQKFKNKDKKLIKENNNNNGVNMSTILNNSDINKINDTKNIKLNDNNIKINNQKKNIDNDNKSINNGNKNDCTNHTINELFNKSISPSNQKDDNSSIEDFHDHIKLNLFDYLCHRKNPNKKKHLDSFNLGISFYKKKMDLIHFFTVNLITERVLLRKEH